MEAVGNVANTASWTSASYCLLMEEIEIEPICFLADIRPSTVATDNISSVKLTPISSAIIKSMKSLSLAVSKNAQTKIHFPVSMLASLIGTIGLAILSCPEILIARTAASHN